MESEGQTKIDENKNRKTGKTNKKIKQNQRQKNRKARQKQTERVTNHYFKY